MASEAHSARFLLALLRQDWSEAERLRCGLELVPESFVRLVRECDAHPWLHARLSEARRFDLVGREVEQRLAELRHKCRSDNLLLLARAEQALDLLLGAGVVPIALKGLDFMHRLYARVDERTLDDVDLLVRLSDLGPALAALERAGWAAPPPAQRDHYLRSSHHLPLASPGPITVDFEIHWNLVQERRYRLGPRELFDRAVPLEVAGRGILRLEDHDVAAHLLLHHVTHYFDRRLKWSLDLRQIASRPAFRWSEVAGRVKAWGARAAVGLSLRHLGKVFPELVPAELRRELAPARWRALAALPLRSSHPLDLFRGSRRRGVQLYLAAVMLERPASLPAWLWHRARRDRRPELSPLAAARSGRDAGGPTEG